MKPQQASRTIRSSRSRVSLLALLLLAGCATPERVSINGAKPENGVATLDEISFTLRSQGDDLALVYGDRSLFLGVDREEAREAFAPLDKALEFSNKPAQFGDKFGAFGWETNDFAFGCITFEQVDTATMAKSKVVVQAMYTVENATEEAIEAVLLRYRELYGEPASEDPGARIGYWFWYRPGRRLMVNTSTTPEGKRALTVAVGEPQVMTLLGMSVEQSGKDKKAAIQRLNTAAAP